MNEVLKAIANRRSVRAYKDEQIKDEELAAILEAGLQAPSGHNDQSWYFTVVQNKELINKISDGSKIAMQNSNIEWMVNAGKNEKLHIFYYAPTIIIISARKDAITPLADACAAMENIFLAAESLNIGSCWIGFAKFYFLKPESYKEFGIPEGYDVQYAISLGYKQDNFINNPPVRKYEKYFNIIK